MPKISRCSAAGSARGLGPWGRRFEPCHLDQKMTISQYSSLAESIENSHFFILQYSEILEIISPFVVLYMQ